MDPNYLDPIAEEITFLLNPATVSMRRPSVYRLREG